LVVYSGCEATPLETILDEKYVNCQVLLVPCTYSFVAFLQAALAVRVLPVGMLKKILLGVRDLQDVS